MWKSGKARFALASHTFPCGKPRFALASHTFPDTNSLSARDAFKC